MKALVMVLCMGIVGCAKIPLQEQVERESLEILISKLQPKFSKVQSVTLSIQDKVGGGVAASSGNTHCRVSVSRQYLRNAASQTEVAFVLAHELAHCEAAHSAERHVFENIELNWRQEFAADRRALEVTRKAGLGDVASTEVENLPFFLRKEHLASSTHPSGEARFNALKAMSPDSQALLLRDGHNAIIERL